MLSIGMTGPDKPGEVTYTSNWGDEDWSALSEESLAEDWDSEADAIYDDLEPSA